MRTKSDIKLQLETITQSIEADDKNKPTIRSVKIGEISALMWVLDPTLGWSAAYTAALSTWEREIAKRTADQQVHP